jgi:hypothetical protein
LEPQRLMELAKVFFFADELVISSNQKKYKRWNHSTKDTSSRNFSQIVKLLCTSNTEKWILTNYKNSIPDGICNTPACSKSQPHSSHNVLNQAFLGFYIPACKLEFLWSQIINICWAAVYRVFVKVSLSGSICFCCPSGLGWW